MKTFDVQSIALETGVARAFEFIATPKNLPLWTSAFKSLDGDLVQMRTTNGAVAARLEVRAPREQGTIDWALFFPDGSQARAYSRLVPLSKNSCVFVFIMLPPPVALEQLEGALEQQAETFRHELAKLQAILNEQTV